MGHSAPTYVLSRPESTQYKLQRPDQKATTTPPKVNNSLYQKSNLKPKSSSPQQPEPARKIIHVYSSSAKRQYVELSDSEDDDKQTADSGVGTASSSCKSEAAFILPSEFDFKALNERRKSFNSAVFQSPDDIKATPQSHPSSERCFVEPPDFDFSIISPKRDRRCPFCRKHLPQSFQDIPPTAPRARFQYCKSHENASILEQGKEMGYPTSFDFDDVRLRITSMLKEFKTFLANGNESEFLNTLRKQTSHKNVATPMSMFNVFELTQPGYYGPQGAELISKIMMDNLANQIRNTNKLHDALRFCGGVFGYVNCVLVPEVGVRLIMEDLSVTRDKARGILRASVAYGAVVNQAVEVSDGDDDDKEDDDKEDS